MAQLLNSLAVPASSASITHLGLRLCRRCELDYEPLVPGWFHIGSQNLTESATHANNWTVRSCGNVLRYELTPR
jgi:hypothetical protein